MNLMRAKNSKKKVDRKNFNDLDIYHPGYEYKKKNYRM